MSKITLMEISTEELALLIKTREKKRNEQIIAEKTQEIVNLIKDIKALGGSVKVNRGGKNRYFSVIGEDLKPCAEITGSYVTFKIS